MSLTKSPRDGPVWRSKKYRRWIRDTQHCFFCRIPLANEKPDFLTHHAFHSGGKNPRDQLLVPLCLLCHNRHHAGAKTHQFPNYVWLEHARKLLSEYVDKVLNVEPEFVYINALAQVAMGEE